MSEPLTIIARVRAKPVRKRALLQEMKVLLAPTPRRRLPQLEPAPTQSDPSLFALYRTGEAKRSGAHFHTPYLQAICHAGFRSVDGVLSTSQNGQLVNRGQVALSSVTSPGSCIKRTA